MALIDEILAPGYLADLKSLPFDVVRAKRRQCQDVETALSYERRLIQGRLDIVGAELRRRSGGDEPDPAAAPAARKGALASRTNTMFSIPMLFFMAATSHFAPLYDTRQGGHRAIYYIVVLVIAVFFELNALGVLGGYAPSPTRKFLDDHKQTMIVGFGIWVVLMILWQALFT